MFRSHLVSQGIQKILASMPGRRNSMVQATPEFDNPISIQTLPVLSGGCLAKPQVVEPVEEVDDTLFCKVSKTTPWFTFFVTGCPFSQRPLSTSGLTELIHDKLREHELRLTMRGQAVSSLGLDDEQEDEPNQRFSRLARKRRRISKVAEPIVTLQLPIGKQSADTKDIQILNKSMKDAVWLKLDEATLSWARDYVRSELDLLTHKDQGARADRKEGVTEVAKWCSSASCWRVNFQGQVRNVFVARTPEETFTSRSENAKLKATTIYQRMAENR